MNFYSALRRASSVHRLGEMPRQRAFIFEAGVLFCANVT